MLSEQYRKGVDSYRVLECQEFRQTGVLAATKTDLPGEFAKGRAEMGGFKKRDRRGAAQTPSCGEPALPVWRRKWPTKLVATNALAREIP